MTIFKIENCEKSFCGEKVLKDISLSIKKGEVVSLIGPSGSGKTTLLRCATLLEKMDKGTLTYLDKTIDYSCAIDKQKEKELKKYFSLVFQNFNLFPHFNVLKNIIDAPIKVLKEDPEKAKQEAYQLLDKFGLKDKAEAYPYQLSGGQKQRIAIIRALMMKPEVLFFDEPTSALDPEYTNEVLRLIGELAKEDRTMLIVTHEMKFAEKISDRVIFMCDGEIIEEGKPNELFNNPKKERTKLFLKNYKD